MCCGHLKLSEEYKFVGLLSKLYSIDIIVNTIVVHHAERWITFKVIQVLLCKCGFAKHAYVFHSGELHLGRNKFL